MVCLLCEAVSVLLTMTGCEQTAGDNMENYAQLDSLCLSVTEHALGSSLGTKLHYLLYNLHVHIVPSFLF